MSCDTLGKPILDPCCGSRMFYFDKHDDRVLFGDKRWGIHETLCDGRILEVNPDIFFVCSECGWIHTKCSDKEEPQVRFCPCCGAEVVDD